MSTRTMSVARANHYQAVSSGRRSADASSDFHRRVQSRKRQRRKLAQLRTFAAFLVVLMALTLLILRLTAHNADAVSIPTYKYFTSVQVNPGDSLWDIASENMTEGYDDTYDLMGEIMDINGLRSEQLKAGQTILVPYYSTEYKG